MITKEHLEDVAYQLIFAKPLIGWDGMLLIRCLKCLVLILFSGNSFKVASNQCPLLHLWKDPQQKFSMRGVRQGRRSVGTTPFHPRLRISIKAHKHLCGKGRDWIIHDGWYQSSTAISFCQWCNLFHLSIDEIDQCNQINAIQVHYKWIFKIFRSWYKWRQKLCCIFQKSGRRRKSSKYIKIPSESIAISPSGGTHHGQVNNKQRLPTYYIQSGCSTHEMV